MEYTRTIKAHGKTYSVTIDVNYYVPKAGDIISGIELTEDMVPRIDWDWNEKTKEYSVKPMTTQYGKDDVPVFISIADGITWRITD